MNQVLADSNWFSEEFLAQCHFDVYLKELYENTVIVRKPTLPLEEDSHPTVTVEDESGPVKVRVRTPSLTTPSDEAGGMGGALPSAKDLYGEVASKISKPVDVRSK